MAWLFLVDVMNLRQSVSARHDKERSNSIYHVSEDALSLSVIRACSINASGAFEQGTPSTTSCTVGTVKDLGYSDDNEYANDRKTHYARATHSVV